MHAGKLILTAAVVAAFPLTSCSHHHVQEVDPGTLLSVAKTYRQGPHATTVATPDVENNEKDFKIDVEEMLLDKDFDGLERVAQEARVKQTRLTGGPWKLYKFYEAISTPVAGEKATDDDWKTQLYALKQWENAKATSATAHIATATAYEEYGAFARGTGYANSVGDDAWESLSERYAIAEHELLAAERCSRKTRTGSTRFRFRRSTAVGMPANRAGSSNRLLHSSLRSITTPRVRVLPATGSGSASRATPKHWHAIR